VTSVPVIEASVDVAVAPARLWSMVTTWTNHGRWVPLTTVRVLTSSAGGIGARFVGRTGVGRVGFDDPMVITAWEPPTDTTTGRCLVHKTGRVVRGDAEFVVEPLGRGRSRLRWVEDVDLPPVALTRRLAPLIVPVGRLGVAAVLRRLKKDVESGAVPAPDGQGE
jgi:polyketide cyclase/dehydrase/lipid transport protein